MKKRNCFFVWPRIKSLSLLIMCFYTLCQPLMLKSQTNVQTRIETEAIRQSRYKQIAREIFKDDELFVLFYLDLALVVDPTQETQIVEQITTENPWESLTKYLYGKSDIYFCPSGRQLNIAIEYMRCPIDKDILMSDRYGMYRLSSPEELFKNRGESFRQDKHKAVVFGGLKYEDTSGPSYDSLLAFRSKREALIGYDFLKSTYDEAVYIDSIFRKNGIETALLTGENGTEYNFSQIPQSHADILHIASHGDYDPSKDNASSSSLQEWMMSHSWLALSGANDYIENGGDDGRLTAFEISQTDLSEVKLVVLSACNTGLGDVKENDVYGLLKGFKKAGAGTLLVSLSEVNDLATDLLMRRFYDNIFRGDNPRRALENAQRYIRVYGNGQYNKPEYWASFILVDDLDRNVGKNVSDEYKQAFLSEIIRVDDIYSENTLFPNWEKLKKCFGKDDVVLRIFSYKALSKKRNEVGEYIAMVGSVDKNHCSIVRLDIKDWSQNKGVNHNSFPVEEKNDNDAVNTLWGTTMPFIENKSTIYVQVSGLYNDLPIESSPKVGNHKIIRLSSLDVLMERNNNAGTGIALFGGLDYDLAESETDYDNTGSLLRGIILGVCYLPGTKRETDSIYSLFERTENVFLFQGSEGTELAFRELSKKKISTIHIATHSFHLNNEETDVSKAAFSTGKVPTSISDILFSNVGLFLSGCNKALCGESVSFWNDGIIMGTDITNLDFNCVELLGLSACETAKDSGFGDENKWNLVKAFKKAGVHTILASLWKVDDNATCLLMTEFYKNWISNGMTKHDALEVAKQTVRSHTEKGWDDPKYWAAFILLDALD